MPSFGKSVTCPASVPPADKEPRSIDQKHYAHTFVFAMNPGLKLFDRLCTSEQTKTKAQEFLSVCKGLRPGQGTSSLPNGALSICAYLASEYTQQADISPSAAFQESKLPNLKTFSQSIAIVEELLCEASGYDNPMFAKFTYTRLATNSPRCRRCSNDGIPCIALRKICGKREIDFCLACTALKVRSCQKPEVIDLLSDDDTQPAESSNRPSVYPIKCEPVDSSLDDARPAANATPATQQPHGAETPFKYRQSLPLSSPRVSSDRPPHSAIVPPSPLLPSVSPSIGHTLPTRFVPPQANPHNTPKSPLLGPMPASVAPNGTSAAKRVAQISKTASDASLQKSPQALEATTRTPSTPQTPSQPRTPRVRKPTETNATPGPSRIKKEVEKKGKVAPTPKKRELDIPTTLLPVFDDDEPAIIPIMSRRRTSTGGKRFGEVKEEAPVAKKKKRKLCLFTSAERVGLPPLVIPDRPVASAVAQAPMTPRATPGPSSAVDVPTSVSEDPMDVDPPHTVADTESLSAPAVLQRSSIAAAPATLQQPSPLPTPPLTNYIPALYELPEWIVSHVRMKACEIITHVDKFGCESPGIAFPISDMRHRLAMISRQESAGTQDNLLIFKHMLLNSGKDVVAAFAAEGTQDAILECLITELGERLRRMEGSSA